MIAVNDATPTMGTEPACRALGLSRATLYRGRRPAAVARPRPAPPRALRPIERHGVLDLLHTRFVDQAPAQVHATLLDEGTYLCSPRTMYRLLDAAHEIKERRDQVRRPHYAEPELLATRPNEVWSWDITKLLGPGQVDLLLSLRHPRHLQPLRRRLDARAARERGPGRAPHRRDLREARHSAGPTHAACRPRLLDDGASPWRCSWPTSASPRPTAGRTSPTTTPSPKRSSRRSSTARSFPSASDRSRTAARSARRSSPGTTTSIITAASASSRPRSSTSARPPRSARIAQQVLAAAYAAHPERFVNGRPRPADLPTAVWINPPAKKPAAQDAPGTTIVTVGRPTGRPDSRRQR